MAAPLNSCTTIEQRGGMRFLWAKNMAVKDIDKEILPVYGEHCVSRQAIHNWPSKTISFGRTLSLWWCSWKSSARVVLTGTTRILHRRFPGTCETVGQVFKFVCRFTLKNKCCLYAIILISLFSITICNLLIDFPSYVLTHSVVKWLKYTVEINNKN
jgi:hypothetical protein